VTGWSHGEEVDSVPKPTFFNLPESKQQAIITAAIEEFAAQPYELASVSKIVSKANIAKGSMYQYFENKRELYLYVLDLAYAKKKQFLQTVFTDRNDFFTTLKQYYKRSYMFACAYPMEHQIITNYWERYCEEEFDQQIKASRELRAADFLRLMAEAAKDGQINPHLDQDAVFFVYHSVGKELIDNFTGIPETDYEQHLRFIENVLDVLAEGLRKRREDEICG